ncbi:MAG: TonB-dependent receptor, partial [Sphingomonadales bacterium]
GLYVDEVYIGRSFAFMTTLMDIERVEVLRGPQGTLFGRNTVGGAINIFTGKPGPETVVGGDFTYGNYDLVQVRGQLGGAIVEDKVFARISGTHRKHDGFLRDFETGDHYNNEDYWSTRAKVLVKASEQVEVLLSADYYKDSHVDTVMDIRGGALAPLDPYPLKDRLIGTDFDAFSNREIYGLSGQVNWDAGDMQITSITAYREHKIDRLQDQDFSVADISFTGRLEDQSQFSQELRVAGDVNERLNFLVGAYYFHQNNDARTTANLGADILSMFGGTSETAFTDAVVKGDAYAGFGSFNYSLTDQLVLSGGIRYTHEKKTIDYVQTLSDGAFVMPLAGIAIPIAPLTDRLSQGSVTGDASLSYKPTEDITAYVSYGRGFKAGGFNATLLGQTPDDLVFEAEYLDSYEAGIKSSWFEDRLRLNVAAFYMDYSDKQEQTRVGTTFLVSNAASARSKGFEIELMARPHPQLELMAGYGYTNAKYKAYEECANVGGSFIDCTGNRLQFAPRHTASFAFQFDQPVSDHLNLFTRGEVTHRSSTYLDVMNNPDFTQSKRTLVNGRVGIEDADGQWSVAFWGRNIFNTEREVLSFDFQGTQYAFLNAPRTYGIELSARY